MKSQQATIIINEIMIDPDPIVKLPNAEYIELKNVSENTIDLKNYIITDNSRSAILPNYLLKKDSIVLVVTTTQRQNFIKFGNNVIGVSNFPSLNNDKDTLLIYNPNKEIIFHLAYDEEWYSTNSVKQLGGWSLEMIDDKIPFGGSFNWGFSIDENGGTPCKNNSITRTLADTVLPLLVSYKILNNQQIELNFNKALHKNFYLEKKNFNINHDIMIDSVLMQDFLFKKVQINLNKALEEKMIYTLTIKNIQDKSNNINLIQEQDFGLTSKLERGDLIINEILFNPISYSPTFIEIYNNSDKIFDLNETYISRISQNKIAYTTKINNEKKYIFPHSFITLTTDSKKLQQQFPNILFKNFIDFSSSTSLLIEDESQILLYNQAGAIIDEAAYSKEWHSPYLIQQEGVSLEKIFYTLDGQLKESWHSAAYPNLSTPCQINSQFKNPLEPNKENIELSSTLLTPNQDGENDFLIVKYEFEKNNITASLKIFSLDGILVASPLTGQLLSTKGTFRWDCLSDSKQTLALGNYIFLMDVLEPNGKTYQIKKVITIAP